MTPVSRRSLLMGAGGLALGALMPKLPSSESGIMHKEPRKMSYSTLFSVLQTSEASPIVGGYKVSILSHSVGIMTQITWVLVHCE